ncbi:hypothetical protein [Encephalitozoon cuniculi GB-M1]|uniref:Uncharacterized protein n=2 Tax=Encephalitozoon cuniculi TaxID=6035 RepID=Q8SVR0_ENCCU|nr:uncharacterized protein ECU04_1450 [Encephalitozoon cuniculi GB-M1]AGE95329.1 hypothetical protein ECU04_1450 [Encephalitozoon cuniculi]KMV66350.1 hypothetical protein M970_041440 [Encephalitozoon cuniculi EcunIII-L]UYI27532.1 putative DNA-dependent RNA polymerase subunit [Encephalitozoon cuniculi]CAD25334.1 hypothetical protein [Encephalitozoon cuniculi GB-M1]
MIKFKLVEAVMCVEIDPELLVNPEKAVSKHIASNLLIYSHKINGVPLSFSIKGMERTGPIVSSVGSVAVAVHVEYVVLTLPIGEVMSSIEGRTLGIFSTDIDGSKEYTGNFVVKEMRLKGRVFFTIAGTRP